ncbi:MAG: hypothetical protein K2X87_06815 [Gemmataceae bacterium]|nr:hypothetical protein [Gemmataceae bacterium]
MADLPPAVRLLPMDPRDDWCRGRSVEEVQAEFFLGELPFPPRNGRWRYRSAGLRAAAGSVVLFQFGGRLIASAAYDHIEPYPEPDGEYGGAMHFDPESIRVFDPVGPELVRAVWPTFRRFGQAKHALDPAGWPEFARRLTGVRAPGDVAGRNG